MAPYDEVFTRLKTGDETRKRAQSLYIQAAQLTTHGSGRCLGQGHSALVAICAFLASQRLGNGEVTKAQACAAACVDPRTFEIALSNVESVLRTAPSPQRNQKALTFWGLSKEYVSREDACVPMVEVEAALKACGALVDGTPIDPKSPLTQCAIFYWVCTTILRVTVPDDAHFREMLKVSPKKWVASQRILENYCSHMVDDLTRKAKTALTARTTRSQHRASTQEKMHASLTNLASRSNGLFVPLTPPKTPLSHNMKRKTLAETEVTPLSSTQGSPSVGAIAFNDTALALTSMSDTPSSISSQLSVREIRVRHWSPVKKPAFSVQEDEEISRRRRRNLRATFLDPSMYGWKPDAQTAKKLERARNWESHMVERHGDPWDG